MEIKAQRTEVVEKYCWAITQATTCVMLQPVRFQCVGLRFHLDSITYTYLHHIYLNTKQGIFL